MIKFDLEDFSVMSETKIDKFVKAFNQSIDENISTENVVEFIEERMKDL